MADKSYGPKQSSGPKQGKGGSKGAEQSIVRDRSSTSAFVDTETQHVHKSVGQGSVHLRTSIATPASIEIGHGLAKVQFTADKTVNQMTSLEKMEMARSGVSKKYLENLKMNAALGYDALAKVLSVTRATLINKKGNDKFNPQVSERILGLADIYSYGYEVFEDEERFNKWMSRPNQALGGHAPYELLDSQFGREEVRDVIGRIDYGVYS